MHLASPALRLTNRTLRHTQQDVNTLLPMETRGTRLRRYLLRLTGGPPGWVNALADKVGVTRQTLGNWMGDRVRPDLQSIEALAAALDVRPWQVVAAMDGDEAVPLDEVERRVREMVPGAVAEFLARQGDADGDARS